MEHTLVQKLAQMEVMSHRREKLGEIAYVVNEYPKISHSFIRREILALEGLGWTILRFSIRGWNAKLIDPDDVKEQKRTRYILFSSKIVLLVRTLSVLFERPVQFIYAFFSTLALSSGSKQGLLYHIFYFIEACNILALIRHSKVMHVHAHFGTNSATVALILSQLSQIPFSFTVHGPEEFDDPSGTRLAFKIKRAAFVNAVSSFGRSQLMRLAAYEKWSDIKVAHCGIDAKFLESLPTAVPDCIRLVCVGRLCEQKGQALLIQALQIVKGFGKRFELSFLGDGDDRVLLQKLIDDSGLTSSVKIDGWADSDTVKNAILDSRALVLPSFAEGLPVVLMEAMALNRPVITTYVAGHPELVVDGQTGWLVPAGSAQHLAEAIVNCLDLPVNQLTAMGALGRERVKHRHNVEVEASKLSDFFRGTKNC